MKKRSLSVMLALLILLASICTVSAYETSSTSAQDNSSFVCKTVSEYEVIANLARRSSNDLIDAGYSLQEIQNIKNYKELYVEHIGELNNLSTEVLKEHGYTNSQIYDIRNFTGAESQIARVGATVTLQVNITSLKYDGNYTRGTVIYSWLWNGVPEFKMKDIVAFAWNDWSVEAQRSNVSYMNIQTGKYIDNHPATYTEENVQTMGAAHRFNVSEDNNYSYAKTGDGSFSVKSDVHARKDMYLYASYGHSEILASAPSYSVSTSGSSLSISFSLGVSTVASVNKSKVCL